MLNTLQKHFVALLFFSTVFLLFTSCNNNETMFELHVISTNDIHGHALAPNETTIGYNHIASYVKTVRSKHPNVLLVDAGGYTQGTPNLNLSRGLSSILAMNSAQYDFAGLGNHEFSFGSDRLFELINAADFPMLSANAIYQNRPQAIRPYESIVMNNVRIAIIGATTPKIATETMPLDIREWNFVDPSIALKPIVARLSRDHQIIIVLAHLGNVGPYTSTRLAKEVPGIHLIIDGHDHTVTPNGRWVDNTFIMNSGEHSQHLAHTVINLTGGRISSIKGTAFDLPMIELNTAYTPDFHALANQSLMTDFQNHLHTQLNTPVVEILTHLEGAHNIVQIQDTNLGRLIADSFRTATEANIAIVNGGSIRNSLSPGMLTYENMLSAMPLNNRIQVITVTGEELIKALEHSVSAYPEPFGGFLHVSGLNFSFNPYLEAGSRIVDVFIGGSAISRTQEYTIAMPSFLAQGGEGFNMFQGKPHKQFVMDIEILIDYILHHNDPSFPEILEPKIIMVGF